MPKPRLKPPRLKTPRLKASLQGRSGATTGKKGVSSGATTGKKSVSSGKTTGKKGVSSGKTSGVTSPKRQSASHERSRSALHNVDVLREHGASRAEIERELARLLGEFREQRDEISAWMREAAADVAAGPSSAKH